MLWWGGHFHFISRPCTHHESNRSAQFKPSSRFASFFDTPRSGETGFGISQIQVWMVWMVVFLDVFGHCTLRYFHKHFSSSVCVSFLIIRILPILPKRFAVCPHLNFCKLHRITCTFGLLDVLHILVLSKFQKCLCKSCEAGEVMMGAGICDGSTTKVRLLESFAVNTTRCWLGINDMYPYLQYECDHS